MLDVERSMDVISILNSTSSELPAYKRISTGLERAIACGDLPVGSRLPSERALARELLSSRTTVVAAYEELHMKGLISRHVGRGSYVSAAMRGTEPFAWSGKVARSAMALTATVAPSLDSPTLKPTANRMRSAGPAVDVLPSDFLSASVSRVLRQACGRTLVSAPLEGDPRLREEIAEFVGCSPGEVLITSGVQQGLDLVARYLVDPKESVVVDQPGHDKAFQLFRSVRAQIIGWSAPEWDPSELQRLVIRHRPKLIYTNPSFHNPTGATMEAETRRELLRIATSSGVPLVEDDTYSMLHWNRQPPPSLRDLDATKFVIRVGSFSMILGSGVRVGYVIAPEQIMAGLATLKKVSAGSSDCISQLVVAELLRSGAVADQLPALRLEHKRRYDALMAVLAPLGALLHHDRPNGGIYAWFGFREEAALLARAASRYGLGVPGSAFFAFPTQPSRLRVCFASARPEEIHAAGRRLLAAAEESRVDR